MSTAEAESIKSEIKNILDECGLTREDQAKTTVVDRLYKLVATARQRGANDTWSTLNEMVGMAKPPLATT